jgi:hypothetical protein
MYFSKYSVIVLAKLLYRILNELKMAFPIPSAT